ncbi:formylglycine-generating enzyme family protein [soil metagenome]
MTRGRGLGIAALLAGLLSLCAGCTTARVLVDCTDCPPLVVVPAGRFAMGSPQDEPGRKANEGPVHEVRIESFALGRTAVTREQWSAFAEATSRPEARGCEWAGFPRPDRARASWRTLEFEQTSQDPVVCVSGNDARDYTGWLSQRTGHRYRLPTEAEWEYAARAGSTSAYPWGATASHAFANYGADNCCSPRADGADRWLFTAPVASFAANRFGLFDMHGNAWQWVEDCYSDDYSGAPADGSAVPVPSCARHVLRGGTWGDTPALIRSAFRNWSPPPHWNPALEYRSGGVGFRVARTLD